MSNPKTQPTAEPSEAVRAFLSPAPSEVFSFKQWVHTPEGPKLQERDIRIRLLRLAETHQAIAAAQQYAKSHNELERYTDIYREAQAVETAWRCMVLPELRDRPDGTQYYPQFFTSAEHLRSTLTEPEIAQIINAYEVVKAKFGTLEPYTPDELDMWAERLSDPMLGEHFLAQLDSYHWAHLLWGLAKEVQLLRQEVGRPLSTSPDSSESSQESSEDGTGSFTELPGASVKESGEELPTDKLLSRSEALQRAKEMRKRSEGES